MTITWFISAKLACRPPNNRLKSQTDITAACHVLIRFAVSPLDEIPAEGVGTHPGWLCKKGTMLLLEQEQGVHTLMFITGTNSNHLPVNFMNFTASYINLHWEPSLRTFTDILLHKLLSGLSWHRHISLCLFALSHLFMLCVLHSLFSLGLSGSQRGETL